MSAQDKKPEPWSSGATAPITQALHAGETITVTFWARSAAPTSLKALLLPSASPNSALAQADIQLDPQWHSFTLRAVGKVDAAPFSHVVALHLGQAGTEVRLGPIVTVAGDLPDGAVEAKIRTYGRDRVTGHLSIPAPDGLRLAATLRTPVGHGPFPAVVIIGGSGPGKRGGFAALNDRLLAAGFATLEYDKRGWGQSGGKAIDDVAVHIEDARAVVRFLGKQPKIDRARIGLVGASQGGMVAAATAVKEPSVKAIVMLAGPALPSRAILIDQITHQLRDPAGSGAKIRKQRLFMEDILDIISAEPDASKRQPKIRERVVQAAREDLFPNEAIDMMVAGLSDPALALNLAYRPAEMLARIHVPVLALYAQRDILVSPAENMEAARKALRGNRDATFIELAGVNHMFQLARTGSAEEWLTLGPTHTAPEMVRIVPLWLRRHLGAKRPGDR
ncbi:MAG: alpha/beta fold hydrolase [Sphingomonas sp.]|nr:alpha/beta fold hydrolase [Sphingomonas sp.]